LGKNVKILAVIPARGGSKGVINKNIRMLNGYPLVYYTINCALKSKKITDVVVTTDSEEIQKIAIKYGAEAPFLRPKYLATDKALAIPTVQHAVKKMEKWKNYEYDIVIMLQPTSPMKTSKDIDKAINLVLKNQKAESIISVVDVGNNHPMKMKVIKQGKMVDYCKPPVENPPRQILPDVYIVNGAIYLTRKRVLMEKNTFKGDYCLPYVMSLDKSINIDTEIDLKIAEMYIAKRKKDGK